jgi:hypothetical protein
MVIPPRSGPIPVVASSRAVSPSKLVALGSLYGRARRSSTVTRQPRWASSTDSVAPIGPLPTMTTSVSVGFE